MVQEFIRLLLLAIPIACIAWTVTHEELFREPRKYCVKQSADENPWWRRKFFYIFTCEYCFSHYVTLLVLLLTGFQFLYTGFTGYFLAFFALVWIANVYMSIFYWLRQNLKQDKIEAKIKENELEEIEKDHERQMQ
ncbi:MAG: hypothetical protein Q4F57_05910 [Weeksellaceae bacterium]|nr:hypothetical protein [Weeksellaceae bacterium]